MGGYYSGRGCPEEHFAVNLDGEWVVWHDARWWTRRELGDAIAVVTAQRDQLLAERRALLDDWPGLGFEDD